MDPDCPTERQRRESEHFDTMPELREVNLDHFSKPEFGPWNPYWYVFDFVRRHYRDPRQRLLSFGCGRGANALRYARIGYDVHGFDISPKAIATATKLAEHYQLMPRVHFSVQRAEKLDYPDSFFDIVAGENILHHVDIARSSREILRILKPGGVAIFKEPLAAAARDRFRRSAPLRWLIPIGVKNLRTMATYHHPPDTVKLTEVHIADLRGLFSEVQVVPFRVLAIFNVFARTRTFLEKCDLLLFRLLPIVRRYGDMAVIIARKSESWPVDPKENAAEASGGSNRPIGITDE